LRTVQSGIHRGQTQVIGSQPINLFQKNAQSPRIGTFGSTYGSNPRPGQYGRRARSFFKGSPGQSNPESIPTEAEPSKSSAVPVSAIGTDLLNPNKPLFGNPGSTSNARLSQIRTPRRGGNNRRTKKHPRDSQNAQHKKTRRVSSSTKMASHKYTRKHKLRKERQVFVSDSV